MLSLIMAAATRGKIQQKLPFLLLLLFEVLVVQAQIPPVPTCQDAPFNSYPYCDPTLSPKERAKDLVNRMTINEKVTQMNTYSLPIRSLAVDKYQWWNEALHGVKSEGATSFPQIAGLSCSYDRQLWLDMSIIISTEARAVANGPIGDQWLRAQGGLTYFSPDINIARDPRWGRIQEVPGEDPLLTGEYAVAFVQGLQGHPSDPLYDPAYLKLVATCKHFLAYSVEQGEGYSRHSFNAIVSDRDLEETYLPAFETCVREGKVQSLMCSYNRVNGVPACASDYFLGEVAREQWGFNGYVVSDCGAIVDIQRNHNYTDTIAETCKAAIVGGCDLSCNIFYGACDTPVEQGVFGEEYLVQATERLFEARFALGMFDSADRVSYQRIPPTQLNLPESIAFARTAATKSIVLLKNDQDLLPLQTTLRVAVVGPHINSTRALLGNYAGRPNVIVSPLEGILAAVERPGNVTFAKGCEISGEDRSGFPEALSVMQASDVVILMVGSDNEIESEGRDRVSLTLPGVQSELVRLAVSSGKPVVAVLLNGGAIDVTLLKATVPAIVEAWYPGEQGGNAIADILFGVANPSARLTMTIFPNEFTEQIAMTNMDMRAPPGRTYRFYTGTPVYEFGHGLSYTNFSYSQVSLLTSEQKLTTTSLSEGLEVSVTITNTGKRAGDHVILGFVSMDIKDAPLRSLFDFQRVSLQPNETKQVRLNARSKQLSYVNEKGHRYLIGGTTYRLMVGSETLSFVLKGNDRQL